MRPVKRVWLQKSNASQEIPEAGLGAESRQSFVNFQKHELRIPRAVGRFQPGESGLPIPQRQIHCGNSHLRARSPRGRKLKELLQVPLRRCSMTRKSQYIRSSDQLIRPAELFQRFVERTQLYINVSQPLVCLRKV